jgi:ribosomal protein S18 acetylase RimI-like enzyme
MQPISIECERGPVVIREGMVSDTKQYRPLRLDALQDSPTAFPADYFTSVNRPISFWEGRLGTNEISTISFAEHENQLIGMMGIHRGESPKTKHSADILSVFVRPPWRGLHLAESRINACVESPKSRGVNILKLGVTAASMSAVRDYQRYGFTIYGNEPRGISYNGQYCDDYWMYRALDQL